MVINYNYYRPDFKSEVLLFCKNYDNLTFLLGGFSDFSYAARSICYPRIRIPSQSRAGSSGIKVIPEYKEKNWHGHRILLPSASRFLAAIPCPIVFIVLLFCRLHHFTTSPCTTARHRSTAPGTSLRRRLHQDQDAPTEEYCPQTAYVSALELPGRWPPVRWLQQTCHHPIRDI